MRSRPLHIIPAALLAVWCTALPTPAIAQGTSPFPAVTIDLNSAFTTERLDFDVPVGVSGKITQDVMEIRLTIREAPDDMHKCPSDPAVIAGYTTVDTAAWRRLAGSTAETFSFVIGPLDANRQYCFTFDIMRTLSVTETTAFAAAAQAAVRGAFDNGTSTGINELEAQSLRTQIATDIVAALRPLRVEFVAGSFFCVGTQVCSVPVPFAEVRNRFAIMAARLTGGQTNVFIGQGNIAAIRAPAALHLQQWLTAASLTRLTGEIEAAAATDNVIKTALAPYQPALNYFRGLNPADAPRIVVGLTPAGGAESPQPDWSGVRYEAQRTAAAATRQHAENASTFVRLALATPALRKATTLTDPALQQLALDIDQTRNRLLEVEDELTQIGLALADRNAGIADFVAAMRAVALAQINVFGTSIGDFNTRHARYVSADLGLGYAPDFDKAFSYLGVNIYLRPVNKQAPLRAGQLGRRFAFMVGMTLTGDLTKENDRKPLLGGRMLLAGAGFRFSDSLRIVGGALIFNEDDPNPTVTDERPAWTPFVSLSVDWDVKDSFQRMLGVTP